MNETPTRRSPTAGGSREWAPGLRRRRVIDARLFRLLLLYAGCVAVAGLLFEGLYRVQLVDSYRPELRAFNAPADLVTSPGKRTILIMGDSFTAGTTSYAAILRASLPGYRVINSGITATGVLEASAIARRRFDQFAPSVFVYQIFVGNDLFNITYPINWSRVSFVRNVYWSLAQHFRSIGYLNYRAAQDLAYLKERAGWTGPGSGQPGGNDAPGIPDCESGGPFSVEQYNETERIYFRAEPMLLENQILVRESRSKEYRVLLRELKDLLAHCDPATCDAFVLVVPHACQVDARYLENMKQLRAVFTEEGEIARDDYPFIEGIRRDLDAGGLRNVRLLNPIETLRRSDARGEHVYYERSAPLRPGSPPGRGASARAFGSEEVDRSSRADPA